MKLEPRLLFVLFLSFPIAGFSQQKDTLINKLDSLSKKTDSAGKQVNNISPKAYNESTKLTFNSYCTLLGSDLKQEFTKALSHERERLGKIGEICCSCRRIGFCR